MKTFSERVGLVAPQSLQIGSINAELRNSLWNLFYGLYEEYKKNYWLRVSTQVAQYFRKVPVDELPDDNSRARHWLKKYFFELPWNGVYDLTEFMVNNHRNATTIVYGIYSTEDSHSVNTRALIEFVNDILKRELSGYRFIQGSLTPISNEEEVQAIETAIAEANRTGLTGAQYHIRSAVELLGKKPTPDYRNAIKEAISAVESVSMQIAGADSLDGALKELGKKTHIHGALGSGFSKLYGYTSDEDGIRHAILDDPNVGFTEAKYMIVSCSAFVNYLIEKAVAGGILKVR